MTRGLFILANVGVLSLAIALPTRLAVAQTPSSPPPPQYAPAAPGTWTWMAGSSTPEQPGTYGTTPDPSNTPGARAGSASFTDRDGNLWLFGGAGYDINGRQSYLNDFWEFLTSTNEWVWKGGSSSPPCLFCGDSGVYGTLGTPSPLNIPGGRAYGESWTDANGNFWLLGGLGADSTGQVDPLNDLWEFDFSSRQWIWWSGNSVTGPDGSIPGNYGTKGVPASGNLPGSRIDAAHWRDGDGNLWIFGGFGRDTSTTLADLNDLWKFDIRTKEWTWVTGSPHFGTLYWGAPGNVGVYGTKDLPAPDNTPGSRLDPMAWSDSNGHLWLFGGEGVDSAGNPGNLDDLWEFDPSTSEWTWRGGPGTLPFVSYILGVYADSSVYGSQGVFDAANHPGSRRGGTAWADANGNFWLFGGFGYDAALGFQNDLWEFDFGKQQWAWISGINRIIGNGQPGVYGTRGVPASTNMIGSRADAAAWLDNQGNFWLFGGQSPASTSNIGSLNDLWVYQPALPTSITPAAAPTFTPPAGTYTAAKTVTLADTTPKAAIYYTIDGSAPTTASTLYSKPLSVSKTTTIKAIAAAAGYTDSPIASATYTISAAPQANPPAFSPSPLPSYTSPQNVTITESTPGATIFYTNDGTTPTAASTVFTTPIHISTSTKIEALATAPGYSDSAVITANYTIVLPPDFGAALSAPTLAVTAGQTGSIQLAITPINGFSSAVTFNCSGLPAGAACTFAPASVTPTASGAATTVITISTAKHKIPWPGAVAATAFCLLLFRRRRKIAGLLILLAAVLFVSTGCATYVYNPPTATPTTSTLTITATSGTLAHSTNLTLTVN